MIEKNQSDGSAQRKMDALQKQYERLKEKKTRAEADRDNAEKRLAEVRREAQERYGSDDPEELQKKLERLEAENKKRADSYEAELEALETAVQAVESGSASPEEDTKSDV